MGSHYIKYPIPSKFLNKLEQDACHEAYCHVQVFHGILNDLKSSKVFSALFLVRGITRLYGIKQKTINP